MRLAARVPPTPPPRTTTRAAILVRLAHDEARIPVFRDDLDQLVLGLGYRGRDVGLGTLVTRQDLEDTADVRPANGADQGHQRSGAGHAAGIYGFGYLDCRNAHIGPLRERRRRRWQKP